MRWEQLEHLPAAKFRRLVGVSPSVFEQMHQVAQAHAPGSVHPVKGAKRGPKPKLTLREHVLMVLLYYREYRSFAHLGASFELSETQAWRIVTELERRLLQDERFHLARKQRLRSDVSWQALAVDVGECAVERPKKNSAPATRARKSATP